MPHRIAPVARPGAAAPGADLEDVVLAGDEGADGHVARFAVQAAVLPGALRLAGGGEGVAGFVVARVSHHLDFDDEPVLMPFTMSVMVGVASGCCARLVLTASKPLERSTARRCSRLRRIRCSWRRRAISAARLLSVDGDESPPAAQSISAHRRSRRSTAVCATLWGSRRVHGPCLGIRPDSSK